MDKTSTTISYTFNKLERLCSPIEIDQLFENGISKNARPLKLMYCANAHAMSKIVIIVPKRSFKRANKRNVLKRRMREAYRLNKHLIQTIAPHYNIALLFVAKEPADFATINASVITLLTHLSNVVTTANTNLTT
jgi:ribonuclease P protein component